MENCINLVYVHLCVPYSWKRAVSWIWTSCFFPCFRISVLRQCKAPLLSRLRRRPHLFRHQPPWNTRQRAEKGLSHFFPLFFFMPLLFKRQSSSLWQAFQLQTFPSFDLVWSADKSHGAFNWIRSLVLQSRLFFFFFAISWCKVVKLWCDWKVTGSNHLRGQTDWVVATSLSHGAAGWLTYDSGRTCQFPQVSLRPEHRARHAASVIWLSWHM